MTTPTPHHVLVVEDDITTRVTLAAYLRREGLLVTEAADGASMRKALAGQTVDIVLLDIMLPDNDGLTLLREIRATSDIGVIFVTGKSEDIDRIIGLEMGADDYVTKPFNTRELLARVKTLLRRLDSPAQAVAAPSSAKYFAGWELDTVRRRLTSPDGRILKMTRAEFDLLVALVNNPERVMSRDTLLDHVSSRNWSPYDRTIDVLIGRLRKKIEIDPANPQIIITEHGIGYVFTESVR